MKDWIICKNFILREKPFLGKVTDGTAVYEDGVLTVEIKQNLDDYTKFLTICHEIAHGLDFAFEERKTQSQTEEICNDLARMLVSLWITYPPFRKGMVESDFRVRLKGRKKK